jgi:hypothetical protein
LLHCPGRESSIASSPLFYEARDPQAYTITPTHPSAASSQLSPGSSASKDPSLLHFLCTATAAKGFSKPKISACPTRILSELHYLASSQFMSFDAPC